MLSTPLIDIIGGLSLYELCNSELNVQDVYKLLLRCLLLRRKCIRLLHARACHDKLMTRLIEQQMMGHALRCRLTVALLLSCWSLLAVSMQDGHGVAARDAGSFLHDAQYTGFASCPPGAACHGLLFGGDSAALLPDWGPEEVKERLQDAMDLLMYNDDPRDTAAALEQLRALAAIAEAAAAELAAAARLKHPVAAKQTPLASPEAAPVTAASDAPGTVAHNQSERSASPAAPDAAASMGGATVAEALDDHLAAANARLPRESHSLPLAAAAADGRPPGELAGTEAVPHQPQRYPAGAAPLNAAPDVPAAAVEPQITPDDEGSTHTDAGTDAGNLSPPGDAGGPTAAAESALIASGRAAAPALFTLAALSTSGLLPQALPARLGASLAAHHAAAALGANESLLAIMDRFFTGARGGTALHCVGSVSDSKRQAGVTGGACGWHIIPGCLATKSSISFDTRIVSAYHACLSSSKGDKAKPAGAAPFVDLQRRFLLAPSAPAGRGVAADCHAGWRAGQRAADWLLDESDAATGLRVPITSPRLRDAWRDAAQQHADVDLPMYIQVGGGGGRSADSRLHLATTL